MQIKLQADRMHIIASNRTDVRRIRYYRFKCVAVDMKQIMQDVPMHCTLSLRLFAIFLCVLIKMLQTFDLSFNITCNSN